MSTHTSRTLALLLAAAVLAFAGPAASHVEGYRKADGLVVHLGVMPAQLVRGSPPRHAEERMHGAVPRGAGVRHVMVAVFDEATGERLEDLRIEAEVASLGRPGPRRALEAIAFADAVTYCNYFTLGVRGQHRIRLWIQRPERPEPIMVEFRYDHRCC
jgi:hypothetical protein